MHHIIFPNFNAAAIVFFPVLPRPSKRTRRTTVRAAKPAEGSEDESASGSEDGDDDEVPSEPDVEMDDDAMIGGVDFSRKDPKGYQFKKTYELSKG